MTITCSIGSGWASSNKNNRSPKLLTESLARLWVRGLEDSGLGSGWARARDYFARALFGLGSVQGPDRGWLMPGLVLGLDSVWLGLAQAR